MELLNQGGYILKKTVFHWTKDEPEGILDMMERDSNVEKAVLAEMRKPQSALIDRVTLNNQIILHNFVQSVERTVICQLMGCCQSFPLSLIPNQVLYPKFCEEHRSEFRRQNFLRQLANQTDTYHFTALKVIGPRSEVSGNSLLNPDNPSSK